MRLYDDRMFLCWFLLVYIWDEKPKAVFQSTTVYYRDSVNKKGATSVVWKWFGYRKSDLQQRKIFWKICKKTVPVKGGNTTNLEISKDTPLSTTRPRRHARRRY